MNQSEVARLREQIEYFALLHDLDGTAARRAAQACSSAALAWSICEVMLKKPCVSPS